MKKRILVVEDQSYIRNIVRFNLERAGYDVYQADTGSKAVEFLTTMTYDLVLLDLMLPEVTGFEILEMLQQQGVTKNLPIIVMTAKGERSDVARVIQLGARDFVVKPFNVKAMVEKVKEHLVKNNPLTKTEEKSVDLETGDLPIVSGIANKLSLVISATDSLTIEEAKNIVKSQKKWPGTVILDVPPSIKYTHDQLIRLLNCFSEFSTFKVVLRHEKLRQKVENMEFMESFSVYNAIKDAIDSVMIETKNCEIIDQDLSPVEALSQRFQV
jgi:CheY-like chemotaxis protein